MLRCSVGKALAIPFHNATMSRFCCCHFFVASELLYDSCHLFLKLRPVALSVKAIGLVIAFVLGAFTCGLLFGKQFVFFFACGFSRVTG